MSVELRIRNEGVCDHGPKPIGVTRSECSHVVTCNWGDIENPRPAFGEVGHLCLVSRKYAHDLACGNIAAALDPKWRSLESVTHDDGRMFFHYEDRTGHRWTWELFEAHWFDDKPGEQRHPLYIGRWPD